MSYILTSEQRTNLVALAALIRNNESLIEMALRERITMMKDAAANARASYEAGQKDPALKESQDRSIVTNEGYRMTAEIFAGEARKAEDLIAAIGEAVDKDMW